MEPSITKGHQLLCIKPRSVLLKWVKSSIEGQEHDDVSSIVERVNLSHLVDDATVIVKNFNKPSEIKPFIQQFYRPIFKAEMSRMCEKSDQWPVVDTFQKFNHHFSVEMHSQLIHLFTRQ